ncbi:hypothetical protein GCM10027321_27210 [Massilia terrae]|uniref:Uncharacterized protein n=1 Tax=Massilia terrae TaxID=1811224 RepID=A0ABT2CYS8_9BURK|nr:hypothetical protein [Massilia terrae]MCS0659131.1 hypothetical protein [Massilia terrae]
MAMFRHMEVVLMVCFGLICAAALLAQAGKMQGPVSAEAREMPVVVVIGKRLTAAEKAQALQEAG